MPKLKIEDREYNLPKKEMNLFAEDLHNTLLGNALKMVRSYKRSIDYIPGQTIEDIFNVLVDNERENNIDQLIEQGDKEIDEGYADRFKAVESDLRKDVAMHYEEKAFDLQKNNLNNLYGNFRNKWSKGPDKLAQTILEALIGKEELKNKDQAFKDDFLTKVAQGINAFSAEAISADPRAVDEFLNMAGPYKEMAKAVLDYFVAKKDLESPEMIDRYVKQNVADDPDKFYQNRLENSYDYQQLTNEVKEVKDNLRVAAREQVDELIDVKAPLRDARQAYLQQKQVERENFKDIIAERNNLESRYQKTNVFSRIARWVLPNSWSEAGRIQNEIDKLDKAVKDAGYNKEDVDAVKEELDKESTTLNADAVDNTPTNVTVDNEENLQLQNSLDKDVNQKTVENTQQVVQPQKEEVRQLQ